MAYSEADFNHIRAQAASLGTGFSVAGGPTPKEPPMSCLWGAIDRLRKAAGENAEVTARLCGGAIDKDPSKVELYGDGLFDAITSASDTISQIANSISASATRIQSHL